MRSDDGQRRHVFSISQQELHLPERDSLLLAAPEESIPLSIFSTRLSSLQAIVRHLHEARHRSFSEIARLLNRSQKSVWTTYQQAKGGLFRYGEGSLTIPIARFATRHLSPLETVVQYLLQLGFSNADIARMLALDPRTTWTVQQRIKRKGVSL